MALATTTVWECNASATANNVNGGGFNPGNANFMIDATTDPNTANTDSPILSSASYNFVAGDVGHWVYIQSGTDWTPGWYQIASVASNKATLSAAVGAAIQTDSSAGHPSPRYKTNTVAGCATVGTPTGGVFGIDYSQGTAAIISNTDLACPDGDAASPTVTSVGSPFGVNHTGNIIHITAGTGYTAGWYEIVSVSIVTATLDRAIGTDGAKTNGTFYVGGAMSMNSTLDDDFFEAASIGASSGGGVRIFIKSGTYTLGESVSTAGTGTATVPVVTEGYLTKRGDAPTGDDRPSFSCGSFTFNLGASGFWDVYHIRASGIGTSLLFASSNCKNINCKCINLSTTANRSGFLGSTDGMLYKCEAVSIRGYAFQLQAGVPFNVLGCYFHHSDRGVQAETNSAFAFSFNIISSTVTYGMSVGVATQANMFNNNTFYGAENKTGIGVNMLAGSADLRFMNNIFYGYTTAANHVTSTQKVCFSDYNDWYNNTTDVVNFQKGATDLAVDPQFTNVTQITGTNATSTTNILTAGSGTPFGSVVDSQDFVHVTSGTGTGFTTGTYQITAHNSTAITLNANLTSSGAGTNIAWQITLGHNFAIGTNLKAQGFPGLFPGGLSTGYLDVGAVQRQEPASSSGGGSFTFVG